MLMKNAIIIINKQYMIFLTIVKFSFKYFFTPSIIIKGDSMCNWKCAFVRAHEDGFCQTCSQMKFFDFMIHFQHLIYDKHYCPALGLTCRSSTNIVKKEKKMFYCFINDNNFLIINDRDMTYISLEQIRKYIIITSMYFF